MTPFKLRMSAPLRAELDESAERSGNSLNSEIVQRLGQSLARDRALGSPEMAKLTFEVTVAFASAVAGDDWRSDRGAYARGVTAALDTLIRNMPGGIDATTAHGIISGLLTSAKSRERSK
jgi:hypothetical protein